MSRPGVEHSTSVGHVYQQEAAAIHQRRRAAGFSEHTTDGAGPPDTANTAEPDGEAHSEEPQQETRVGMAFSGGGIRSAAFNLGLAQALHHYGVYRFCDFLSAVSGGTYVAGMLSHSVARARKIDRDNFAFGSAPDGRQPATVRKLIRNGNYLIRLDLLANRYVIGFLLNLIPRLSLLVAIGAGIAFVWRCLDFDIVRDYLRGLGFASDFAPALLPAVLVFAIWFISWVGALVLQSYPMRRWSNSLFFAGLLFLLIGFAVLLGNGDITRPDAAGVEVRYTQQHFISGLLMLLFGLGLLPVLTPRQLLRSGTRRGRWLESWVFYYTSFVLLLGVPLVTVGIFAREDVSGFARFRGPQLARGDLRNRDAFCEWVVKRDTNAVKLPDDEARLTESLFDKPEWKNLEMTAKKLRLQGVVTREKSEELLGLNSWHSDLAPKPPAGEEATVAVAAPDRRCKYSDVTAELKKAADSDEQEEFDEALTYRSELIEKPWPQWRYLHWLGRWGSFTRYLALDRENNRFYEFLRTTGESRLQEDDVRREFNKLAIGNRNFFTITTANKQDTASGDKQHTTAKNQQDAAPKDQQDAAPKDEQDAAPKDQQDAAPGDLEQPATAGVDGVAGGAEASPSHRTTEVSTSPKRLAELLRLRAELGNDGLGLDQVTEMNRLLLENMLPDLIRPRKDIRRVAVIGADQWHRAIWFAIGSVVFLISSWLVDPNTTSLHEYYRDRLGFAFLDEPLGYGLKQRMSLSDCRPHEHGAPYPLFGAAVCEYSPWVHPTQLEAPFSSFLLSPLFCGSERLGFRTTENYSSGSDLNVADAIAISGAALSPSYFVHHIVILIMSILNLRMGKWLPNPARSARQRRTRLLQLMASEIRQPLTDRRHVLVTDGGHVENLGLGELLDRRCSLIILSDAGQDASYEFSDFARLVRRYRSTYGIEFFDMDGRTRLHLEDRFAPNKDTKDETAASGVQQEARHFFCARIRYPADTGAQWGLLIYVKPFLTGDEGPDIFSYAARHKEFPHDSTADQAFSDVQFESYRRLGYHTGEDLCRQLVDSPERLWEQETFDVGMLVKTIAEAEWPFTDHAKEEVLERIDRLYQQLSDGEDREQRHAAAELEKFGEKAVPATVLLLRYAADDREDLQTVARNMLRELNEAGVKPVSQALVDAKSVRQGITALKALESYLRDSVDLATGIPNIIEAALSHRRVSVRAAAVALLGEIVPRTHEIANLLNEAQNDSSSTVIDAALRAMADEP